MITEKPESHTSAATAVTAGIHALAHLSAHKNPSAPLRTRLSADFAEITVVKF